MALNVTKFPSKCIIGVNGGSDLCFTFDITDIDLLDSSINYFIEYFIEVTNNEVTNYELFRDTTKPLLTSSICTSNSTPTGVLSLDISGVLSASNYLRTDLSDILFKLRSATVVREPGSYINVEVSFLEKIQFIDPVTKKIKVEDGEIDVVKDLEVYLANSNFLIDNSSFTHCNVTSNFLARKQLFPIFGRDPLIWTINQGSYEPLLPFYVNSTPNQLFTIRENGFQIYSQGLDGKGLYYINLNRALSNLDSGSRMIGVQYAFGTSEEIEVIKGSCDATNQMYFLNPLGAYESIPLKKLKTMGYEISSDKYVTNSDCFNKKSVIRTFSKTAREKLTFYTVPLRINEHNISYFNAIFNSTEFWLKDEYSGVIEKVFVEIPEKVIEINDRYLSIPISLYPQRALRGLPNLPTN